MFVQLCVYHTFSHLLAYEHILRDVRHIIQMHVIALRLLGLVCTINDICGHIYAGRSRLILIKYCDRIFAPLQGACHGGIFGNLRKSYPVLA